jgi:hypothetical protein
VLEDASSFSLEGLNVALQDLVGEAAEVIMGKIPTEMGRL